MKLGEAVGMGAIANNSEHNSFEMPYRDFLKKSRTSPLRRGVELSLG